MKKIIVSLFFVLLACAIILPGKTSARDNVTDWYIKDFNSEIRLNTNSSLDITERITADCGNLPDKHGIFRVLPEFYYGKNDKQVLTKVDLISIQDFQGRDILYSTVKNRADKTVTWKIGDPNKTVTGANNYEIKYRVSNAVRQGEKDELYWNLNGNFWNIETDRFHTSIIFPDGINKANSEVNLYSGQYREKNQDLARYGWDTNIIDVTSQKTFAAGDGITLSVVFSDGIVSPYAPTFWEQYGSYIYFLMPLIVLLFSIWFWKKFGRDPRDNPTIVPEFGVPDNLPPMELGMVYSDGVLKNQYISAAIINLAVKGFLKIEEIPKTGILGHKDYKLQRITGKSKLSYAEESLLNRIFAGESQILLSGLKNEFYKEIPALTSLMMNKLTDGKILYKSSKTNQYSSAGVGTGIILGALFVFSSFRTIQLPSAMFISGVILIVFSIFMTRRTVLGLKLFRKIQGFKLYMETAEKYRQQFNEKENVFEKFLPYAIMFGMTKEWIKKMKEIYGEKYFASYHPVWFYGYAFANFNVDSLNSAISDMSNNMATTMASNPSSSGAGGGGFSGGGGGGGGGGGW